jgi:hypothetical protein
VCKGGEWDRVGKNREEVVGKEKRDQRGEDGLGRETDS